MNRMMKAPLLAIGLLLLPGVAHLGWAETTAPLQVTILDENGSMVRNAHVYIFSRNKKKFFGTREMHGTATFDLPSGEYRVYAGFTEKTNGIIDHYSSPEANVRVSLDEPAAVILSL